MNIPTGSVYKTPTPGVSSTPVTPISSANQNKFPSAEVAKASPGLYAAATKTGLSADESGMVENWAFVANKHKELMSMKKEDAQAAFEKLEPEVQDSLKYFFNIDYAKKEDAGWLHTSFFGKYVLGWGKENFGVGDVIMSPMKKGFEAVEKYGKALNTAGTIGQLVNDGQITDVSQINKQLIDQAYAGNQFFDKDRVKPLITKYGGQDSFIAMKLLAGMTPGEIIQAWGPNDPQMLNAVADMFGNNAKLEEMLTEFEHAQLSPGRNYAAQWFAGQGLDPLDPKNKKLYNFASGGIDAVYQLAIDPLTYLSGGASKLPGFAGRVAKGEKLLQGGVASVAEHFAKPEVKAFWNQFGSDLGEYGQHVKAKDFGKAAEKQQEILDKYPEFANRGLIKEFSTGENAITDSVTAQSYFEKAENTSKLIRNRINGIQYNTEHATEMRRTRNFKTGARLKAREFIKGKDDFKELDSADLNAWVESVVKYGEQVDGSASIAPIQDAVSEAARKGLRKKIDYLSSRYPASKPIFTDDGNYQKTIDIFGEQAYLVLGDRRFAEVVTIRFANATQAERVALRRSLDEMFYRKMGVDKVNGGERWIRDELNSRYGIKDVPGEFATGFSAARELKVPGRFNMGTMDEVTEVNGTLLPFQDTNAIGPINFTEMKKFLAGHTINRVGNAVKEGDKSKILPTLIGGAFQNRWVDEMTNLWSLFTLAPRLGIRTAIDEGTGFALIAPISMGKEFLNAKRLGNVLAAYTGDKAAVGPVKNSLQALVSKLPYVSVGPTRFITTATRNELLEKAKIMAELSSDGKVWLEGASEGLSPMKAAELFVADMAIEKYARNMPAEYKQWARELLYYNPKSFEDASASQLGNALFGRESMIIPEGTIIKQDSTLTAMQKELGISVGDTYEIKYAAQVEDQKVKAAMFQNFYLGFATKPYKMGRNDYISPSETFLKHNALRTEEDYFNAQEEIMQQIGFKLGNDGKFVIADEKRVDNFLSRSRQASSKLRDMDKTTAALSFIRDSFTELTFRFHGDSEKINDALLDYIKATGKPGYKAVEEMPWQDYFDLVDGFTPESFRTNLKLDKLDIFDSSAYRLRYGQDFIYHGMSRTTDDLVRQPVVHANYFKFRKQYKELEFDYWKQLMSTAEESGISEERAWDIAKEYFTSHAMEDGIHQTLKYVDNPNVRTIFAQEMRTAGRFYRAVEDFQRRMYRVVKNHGLRFAYRSRLMQQGLAANGMIHQDQNGDEYILMPMDDLLFAAFDNGLRTLSGNKMGVSQPLFNDFTLKLSAGNPSFQDDAGTPYLSGPMGSISVLGLKAITGKFNANFSEDLDTYLLGSMGDNVTLKKAIVPRSLQTIYDALTYDEITQQESSATMQAIAYNQANKTGGAPDVNDDKYKNADGTLNYSLFDSDLLTYKNNVQITAHNVLFLRNMLGMISPITPQLRDTKDLPNWSKDLGITSIRSSFFDVLDGIEKMYPDTRDKYELALGVWTAENPGKIVYTVSRKDEGLSIALNYSNEMQNWILDNPKAIEKYGDAALIFAPNIGEFSPGVWNWAQGQGLVDSADITNYLNKVVLQQTVNKYFDLQDKENQELAKVVVPNDRRAIINRYDAMRKQLKLTTPYLEARIDSMANNKEKLQFLNDTYVALHDETLNINPETKAAVEKAYGLFNDFMEYANSSYVANHSAGPELKRTKKDETLKALYSLSREDKSGVVKQLIQLSIEGLMNSKSRDAGSTITLGGK